MDIELSEEEKEFIAKCEEEFKDRFTENDEEFMKVYNSEPATPPVVDNWWTPNNFGYRNDRRNNRRSHHYQQYRNREEYGRDGYGRDGYGRDGYGRGGRSSREYNDNNYGYRHSRN